MNRFGFWHWRLAVFCIGIALSPFSATSVFCGSDDGGKRSLFYFTETGCPDCRTFEARHLPDFLAKHGDQFELIRKDVGETDVFESLTKFEKEYGIGPQDVPQIYGANGAVWKPSQKAEGTEWNVDRFARDLEALVEKELYAETPGTHAAFLALWKDATRISSQPASKVASGPALTIHYFRKAGCSTCGRFDIALRYLEKRYPERLRLERHDIAGGSAKILAEAFFEKYAVPETHRMTAPTVFCGDRAYVGAAPDDVAELLERVTAALDGGAFVPTPDVSEAELARARQVILDRYRSFTWFAVLSAGLLDGVNPCAFVTILFFLSYLTMARMGKGRIAVVGITFTGSVFLTYLLIGFGTMRFLENLRNIPYVAELVRYAMIGFAATVGFLNFRDAWKVAHGSLQDMDLKLSGGLRARIQEVIRTRLRGGHVVFGAAVAGFLVSVFELACTGQVYLPTLLFIVETHGIEARAVALLAGYNAAFVLPLAVLLVLYLFGTTGTTFADWMERRAVAVKCGTGAVFVALAILLLLWR